MRASRRWSVWIATGLAVMLPLAMLLVGGARLAVRTGPGREMVARLLDGLPLGAIGRLHVEGVGGDPLTDLKLARLQIVDARGPWLEARDVEMRWRYAELFSRRFHALAITAAGLTLLRDPVLKAEPPAKGASSLPIAVQVDALALRLQTLPAFSVKRGLYDVHGGFTLERNMAAQGRLAARSLLHAGDGASAVFQVGRQGRVLVRADVAEGQGGALAGSLGLPADQALAVQLRADGTITSGALHLRARTGSDTPLATDASWGNGVARLQARLQLSASRLTRDLAARAGPSAELTLKAHHLQGDVFDVQGLLSTQTARLTVAGPLDWKVRSTSGLKLALQVADAARWAPGVAIGSAQVAGAIVGDPDRFDFKGQIAAQKLAQSGYALARASGPVELSGQTQVWNVQADLSGAGGVGAGVVPGLLGASPRVKLDATRLADGRLLIRSLDATGAGLRLLGQGGQALLGGGLSFKGQAQLLDLAALQKGLRGHLDAAWTAGEAKGDKDWRFGLEAHAGALATGVPAADHFLGATPQLKAEASWGAGGLQVASAVLTGAAVQASVAGRLDPRGPMAFNLDWRAQGPFQAGSLVVAGKASGTGRIGGTLAAPTAELDSQVASLALGRLIVAPANLTLSLAKDAAGVSGQMGLAGPSTYGPASLKAGFEMSGDVVRVHDLSADAGGLRASGSAALQNGAPSASDLTLQVRPGAFISAGRLDGRLRLDQAPGGLAAHLALAGADVVAPGVPGVVHALRLQADGPFDHLPLRITADGAAPTPWKFDGAGKLDTIGSARQLSLTGSGAVRQIGFTTQKPAVVRLDGDMRQIDLSFVVGGGQADLTARQTSDTVSATAHLSGVELSTLDPDYAGMATATLNLKGRGADLTATLNAGLSGARSRDAPINLALDGHLHADLAGSQLRVAASATNPQGLKSSLQVALPAIAAAAPFRIAIDRTRPFSGQFSADGELRPLWDLLVGGDQRLSGRVSTHGALSGTLAAPKVTGHAAIANGRYQNYAVGLDLQQFTMDADFGREAVRVQQISGVDGHGGSLSGSGDISLAKAGGSSFAMKLKRFRVIDNDTATATMSGDVTVTRDARGQAKLAGSLKVDRADLSPSAPAPTGVVSMDVVEINKPGQPKVEVASEAAPKAVGSPPLVLDVSVRASRGIFVKGKGLNVELSLDAHVTGSASAPDLSGTAKVVLGSYDFAGKRFDFDTSSVVHLATKPEDIRLNLIAKRQDATLTAEVDVTGTAARPEIKLSSTPQLPQDEVLSQVLFGSSAAQLTGAQAAELASTLASLSGGGGFDVLGRLRQFAGLDRLAFGQGASGTGVSGGKYVTDAIYVELTGGGREGPSAAVEWRVRRNFSVISRVGTQGDTQLSIQYNTTFK